MCLTATKKMSQFHSEASDLFCRHGMDILSDIGRRNALLSIAQEKFFSDELRASFSVSTDGRSGQPDITVTSQATPEPAEIECKLTTRNRHGGVIFQTDYSTLQRKGKLDYLYVVADESFFEFCVLFFKGLTPDDFRLPANGARGRAGMLKHQTYDRCTVLMGSYAPINARRISEIESLLAAGQPPKRTERLQSALDFWRSAPDRYEICLENVNCAS